MGYHRIKSFHHLTPRAGHSSDRITVGLADVALIRPSFIDEPVYYGVVLCRSTYRVLGFYAGLEPASDVLGRAIRNALGYRDFVPTLCSEGFGSCQSDDAIGRLASINRSMRRCRRSSMG